MGGPRSHHHRRSIDNTMKKCRDMPTTMLGLALLALLITDATGLKNVRLKMTPEVVEYGEDVLLQCYYDLEGSSLYSLKWYRGNYEFYRYSPPDIKIFNITAIDVDHQRSNNKQVTIRNVGYQLSGNFSCEVTTDDTFSTAKSTKALTVVSLPKSSPVIMTELSRYEPWGTERTLRANCSTTSSRPPVSFFFTLNDHQVEGTETFVVKLDSNAVPQNSRNSIRDNREEYQWAGLSMTLQPYHFIDGQLNLRCYAKIPGIYNRSTEVQLGPRQKEPKLGGLTVTTNNTSPSFHRLSELTIVGIIMIHLYWR